MARGVAKRRVVIPLAVAGRESRFKSTIPAQGISEPTARNDALAGGFFVFGPEKDQIQFGEEKSNG